MWMDNIGLVVVTISFQVGLSGVNFLIFIGSYIWQQCWCSFEERELRKICVKVKQIGLTLYRTIMTFGASEEKAFENFVRTSFFFFSHNVFFYPVKDKFNFLSDIKFCFNLDKARTWLSFKPFPNKPWFLRVCSRSLLKTL